MSDALARLRRELSELDVKPDVLRTDPSGRSWLPSEVHELVTRDPRCRAELEGFVRGELELYASADLGSDPFFTARVIKALPRPLLDPAARPSARAWVLAAFHALAMVMAYLTLWILAPEALTRGLEHAHDWIDLGAELGSPWSAALAAVAILAAGLAFVVPSAHTPRA